MKHTIRWGIATLVAMLLPGSLALLRWWAACLFFLVVAGLSMLIYGLTSGWEGATFLRLLLVMGLMFGMHGLAVSMALLIVVERARCDSRSNDIAHSRSDLVHGLEGLEGEVVNDAT